MATAKAYTASLTNLTVLGYLQELQNGADIRAHYIADGAPSQIQGIASVKAENVQMNVVADAGGEGGVIMESAAAALQGLYPIFNDSLPLANGTTVSWSRVQLIPIDSVEVADSYYLEGYTGCAAWTTRLNNFYSSSDFVNRAKSANAFYASISNALGGRPATLQNAWNIFDSLNVQSVHNATFAQSLPPNALAQARYWADYHEAGSFSDPDPNNVGNIAGQAILPVILNNLQQLANTSNPLKIVNIFGAYKPFISLFQLMGVTGFDTSSVVDYASTMLLEVHSDNSVRFLFRNGTNSTFEPYPLFQSGSANGVPLSEFTSKLQPYSLDSDADWCNKCATTSSIHGCDTLAAFNGTGGGQIRYAPITSTSGRHHVSPVVAGVIGAMVTLAFCLLLFLASFLFLRRGRGASTKLNQRARTVSSGPDALGNRTQGPGVPSVAAGTTPYELERRASTSAASASASTVAASGTGVDNKHFDEA
ncbi:hypothetical protein OC846_003219 [Tilletia horrida]|uniref:Phosphoglycerate mutase-like protein n=1 Tax=Tilletia horrida TaxID=155126 RepID=A0AAN6GQU1_9BASI|nr:hypothetical protein OC846_003219 [Tilletia horrida]